MKDTDDVTSISSAPRSGNRQPVHPDDLPKPSIHNGFDPKRDANPGLFAKLFKSAESKQAQAARLQAEAEAEAERVAALQFELRNLEAARQRAEDDLADLEAEHKRLVAHRPGWLEAARAGWRQRNYNNSMLAEVDYVIADYPAHRAALVEKLEAAQAAIAAFQRQHKL